MSGKQLGFYDYEQSTAKKRTPPLPGRLTPFHSAHFHQGARCNDALIMSSSPPGLRTKGVTTFLKPGEAGSAHQIRCDGRILTLGDVPGHGLAAPDIYHQIEVQPDHPSSDLDLFSYSRADGLGFPESSWVLERN